MLMVETTAIQGSTVTYNSGCVTPIFLKPTPKNLTRRAVTPILPSEGWFQLLCANFIFCALPLVLSGFKMDHDRMRVFKIAKGDIFRVFPWISCAFCRAVRIQVLLDSNFCRIKLGVSSTGAEHCLICHVCTSPSCSLYLHSHVSCLACLCAL